MTVADFIVKHNGRHLVVTGPDEGQCTAVAHSLQRYLGLPLTYGHAAQMFGGDPANWTWVNYAPGKIPPPGAQIIWRAMPGNPYGHIAVVMSANANNFTSLDQNWPAGDWRYNVAKAVYHNYGYVIGWGIAKKWEGAPVAGTDPNYAEAWGDLAYKTALGRIATRDERRLRINYPWTVANNAVFGDPAAKTAADRVIKSLYVGILNRDPKNPISEAELAPRRAALWQTQTLAELIAELMASDERKKLEEELAKRKTVEPTPAPVIPPEQDPTKKPTVPTGPADDQPTPDEEKLFGKFEAWLKSKGIIK